MGTFLNHVRRGKIRQPTQIGFTPEVWRQGYEAIAEHDKADIDLFNAAPIFDRIFTDLRNELSKGRFQYSRRRDRLIAICAFINHEVAALERKRPRQQSPAEKSAPVLVSDLINLTVTLRSGVQITPDDVLSTVIDAAVLPLDEALQATDDSTPLATDTMTDMGLAFMVANLYCVAVALWSSCLWTETLVEQGPGRIVIRARDF